MIYFIADTHFGHYNIIEYCNRPFKDCVEMDRYMIDRWNKVVSPKDIVYHLGDFALCYSRIEIEQIVRRLNGKKILIMGNHDRPSVTFWRDVGVEMYKKPIIFQDMWLSHQPIMFPDLPNIHGHVHNNPTNISGIHVCVSVEQVDYTPVTIEKVTELVDGQKRLSVSSNEQGITGGDIII